MRVGRLIKELKTTLGIKKLYPPQKEAIGRIDQDNSVLMAVPTSAGKTLVGYYSLIKNVKEGKKGFYIVPLRALAWEKLNELREIAKEMMPFCRIGVTVGDYDKIKGLGKYDIIVATSERMDSLLRQNPKWLTDVGTIIVDEVHLLNDGNRGPTLEVSLTRFRRINPSLQIVALSATVSNSDVIADWLDADLVESDFRPVPLRKGVSYGENIAWEDGKKEMISEQGTEGMIGKWLPEQTLVFVSTRRGAEAQARRSAAVVRSRLGKEDAENLSTYVKKMKGGGEEKTPIDESLGKLIASGVCYHHAGLSNRQRKIIEEAFRSRSLKVLVATPTLAAGINLPAKRVIIRDLSRWDGDYHSNQPLPVLEIQQMLGRAGRPKYDSSGEGVLVAKDQKKGNDAVERYFESETEPVISRLGSEAALRIHLLSVIASRLANTRKELDKFLKTTLFGKQGEIWAIKQRLSKILNFLAEENFIEIKGGDSGDFVSAADYGEERFEATELGMMISRLYIDPKSGSIIRKALESDVEANPLGILHTIMRTPDIYSLYVRKNEMEDYISICREVEDELMSLPPLDEVEFEFYLWDLKTALLLMDWMEEMPEEELLKKYSTTPGDIRAKVDRAEWLLYATTELAKICAEGAVPIATELRIRIKNGVKKELVPLLMLDGVGRIRARSLYDGGFEHPRNLENVYPKDLVKLPNIGPGLAEMLAGKKGPEQMKL